MSKNNNGQQKEFNPSEHLMQLKSREGSKDYLPVQWRLVWINDEVRRAIEKAKKVELEITSELVALDMDKECEAEKFVWNSEKRRSEKVITRDNGYCIYRAKVRLRIDDMVLVGTGDKMETKADFKDFIEKAQTGAKGRALADIGYGTQFAPELDEAHRIVDAPVDRAPGAAASNGHTNHNNGNGTRAAAAPTQASNGAPEDENAPGSSTKPQRESIRKLCQHIGKSEPDNLDDASYKTAKILIQGLTAEYKESRKNSKQ